MSFRKRKSILDISERHLRRLIKNIFNCHIIMGKHWCVVEFTDGVQIVPQLWIEGDKCYWPTNFNKNSNSQKLYEKAVREYKKPESTWPLHTLRILGVYDSYDLALPKLKLAEVQSDLNTDSEEMSKKNRSSRKKIPLSSDEEEEFEEELSGIKPFPKIPADNQHLEKKKKIYGHVENRSLESPSTSDGTAVEPTVECCTHCRNFDKEYKMKTQRDIKEIKAQVKLILDALRNPNQRPGVLIDASQHYQAINAEEYEGKLPMKSEADVGTWETLLSAQDEQKKMITFLARIGGNEINSIVKNMLRKLFADSVACLYNWEGKKSKKMFSGLILSNCIKKAAVLSPNGTNKTFTEQDIVTAIKNWLRHASARLNNNKKNKENVEDDEVL